MRAKESTGSTSVTYRSQVDFNPASLAMAMEPASRSSTTFGISDRKSPVKDVIDRSLSLVADGFDVLNFIDFQWDEVSTAGLRGHFLVTPKICQPFGVLHGGITAFLAENLSSMGASVVSNWERVAGLDLSVNHLLSASIGETVHVKASPLRAGKRVQVWDVTFTKAVKAEEFATTAVARLTLLVGLPGPETAKVGNERLMAIAKALTASDLQVSKLLVSKL